MISILDTGSQCVTTADSPQNPSSQCMFPFNFDGQTFNECLRDFETGNYWCPTTLDENGEYISNEGNWGFCDPLTCPPLQAIQRAELPPKRIAETTTPNVPSTATVAEIITTSPIVATRQARQGNLYHLSTISYSCLIICLKKQQPILY